MSTYTEKSIQTLDWKEHIRARPGMYIGKLGDGSQPEDGIYVLLKEIIDNSIDEHLMGFGKKILITTEAKTIRVRDFGRGIPLGKLVDCVAKINTGGKYSQESFHQSIGLNGVGTKAVNALSAAFTVTSIRNNHSKHVEFCRGEITAESAIVAKAAPSGTEVVCQPDPTIFGDYTFMAEHITELIWNYAYLNVGLKLYVNGDLIESKLGLVDHLNSQLQDTNQLYPICHLHGQNWELAFSHTNLVSDEIYSFVNGQHTPMGGTHVQAFREVFMKVIRTFYRTKYEAQDIKQGLRASLCIRMHEPLFESQTKTRLGSTQVTAGGPTIRVWLLEELTARLELHLHQHAETALALENKIKSNKKSRLALLGAKTAALKKFKRSDKYNKKLRDCKIHHYPHTSGSDSTMIFLTEGDSASGSITKSRDPRYQAVFSLRGKPLNTFNLDKTMIYQNEELHLLAHALRLEDATTYSTARVRYRKIILATDADVDGMHIRLLLLTFFLKFYPEVVRAGFVYILETPLFRLRDHQKTIYCYSEAEKHQALAASSKRAELTRFKGLGEISPHEFRHFIGPDMRLVAVSTHHAYETHINQLLTFYMGGNSLNRKDFIIRRLRQLSQHNSLSHQP